MTLRHPLLLTRTVCLFRGGSLWPDHGLVSVKKRLHLGKAESSQPISVLVCGQHVRKYTIFPNPFAIQGIDYPVVDQIMRQQRRDSSVRTVSTDVGQPSPHFNAQPFLPHLLAGGATFPRTMLIGRYNLILGRLADRGDLAQCLYLAAQMKAQGVKPDILTYDCLIRACVKDGLAKEAMAIFEDMLATGLRPERETFHLLFEVRFPHGLSWVCSLTLE